MIDWFLINSRRLVNLKEPGCGNQYYKSSKIFSKNIAHGYIH